MEFCLKEPKNVEWKSPPIRLRNGQTIWLSCNYKNKPYTRPKTKKDYYFPYLQSNLQKAMRRQLKDVCVATAYQMMLQDMPKFLRRLPIILLEDVWPHPKLDFVVWLMAAVTKGWIVSEDEEWTLLQIVWEAALQTKGPSYDKKFGSPTFNNDTPSLIKAMVIRQNYGGMKGDQQMIVSLIEIWSQKLGEGYDLLKDWPYFGEHVMVEFGDEHRLPEAIDFHNSNIIDKLVSELGTEKQELRKDIWDNRSSINFRDKRRGHLSVPKHMIDALSMDMWKHPPRQSNSKRKRTSKDQPPEKKSTSEGTPSVLDFF